MCKGKAVTTGLARRRRGKDREGVVWRFHWLIVALLPVLVRNHIIFSSMHRGSMQRHFSLVLERTSTRAQAQAQAQAAMSIASTAQLLAAATLAVQPSAEPMPRVVDAPNDSELALPEVQAATERALLVDDSVPTLQTAVVDAAPLDSEETL